MITNPITSNLGTDSVSFFQRFIPSLVSISLVIGSLIFFFNLILGAIKWISSGGEKDAVVEARGKVTNALVGLVILFASFAILNVIEYFFHIKILTLDIGSLIIK